MESRCCEHGDNIIEDNILLVEDKGCLQLYKCKICGEEFWVHGDFLVIPNAPLQKCRIYVEWSKESSLVSQINTLKKIIPNIKKWSNSELLKSARTNDKWIIDEMYVSEAKELIKLAKEQKLILGIEKL